CRAQRFLGLDREAIGLRTDLSVSHLDLLSTVRRPVLSLDRDPKRRTRVLRAHDGLVSPRDVDDLGAHTLAQRLETRDLLLELDGAALERVDPALRTIELRLELEH